MYMDSVVITGADGFIGSHMVRHFAAQGLAVYALVIPQSPIRHRIEGIEHVTILEGDLADRDTLAAQLPEAPVAFIHLAWAGVSPEARNSVDLQLTNVMLSLNAARLAHAIHAQRFILPGSTSEYTDCGREINESACPSPQNAYGAAKVSSRYLCGALCEELGISYIYVVITGIYAADRVDNNVIYYTISSLLQKQRPSYTKLEQLWDYVHIDDVVQAFYLIATRGKGGAFYSIGHGDNWPLANYIYMIRDIIDPNLPLGIGEIPYKGDKRPSSCVDLRSLREDTGFVPRIAFEDGIRDVIEKVAQTLQG